MLNKKKEGLGEPALPGAIAGQDRTELTLSFGPAVNEVCDPGLRTLPREKETLNDVS